MCPISWATKQNCRLLPTTEFCLGFLLYLRPIVEANLILCSLKITSLQLYLNCLSGQIAYLGMWTLFSGVSLTFRSVAPKLFQLVVPLAYWAIGLSSPFRLQSYALYRLVGFFFKGSIAPRAGFHGSSGSGGLPGNPWFRWSMQSKSFETKI